MSKNDKTLHLFTAEYPYGLKSETFLETEINYLSKKFNRVIIYPGKLDDFVRLLPVNVTVNSFRGKLEKTGRKKSSILLKYLFLTLRVLTSEIGDKGLGTVVRNIKSVLDYLAIQLLEYNAFRAVPKEKSDVFYDYWFSNATLMLSFTKQREIIDGFVSRAHGFDIYDERWGEIGVPFRKWKMEKINKLFVISQFGLNYIKQKISESHFFKLEISFLGVENHEVSNKIISKPSKIIVSCSGVDERKQVLKTVDLLKEMQTSIHWIHFGDGPQMESLKSKIKEFPDNISVDLKGHASNSDVISFYKNNHVDLFLSLSVSEGIPVSMMEAISFGIPIAAYPVGGVPEIVIPEVTGCLLNTEQANEMELITKLLESPIERNVVLTYYRTHFSAQRNYTDFISRLC